MSAFFISVVKGMFSCTFKEDFNVPSLDTEDEKHRKNLETLPHLTLNFRSCFTHIHLYM